MAFTILGMLYGDCLLIYKWRARCQVTNISRWCCWFQTRFYLLWAWNYTTQAVCGTRASDFLTSWWHSEVSKPIVPKIHMPTLLPLWQTYHAFTCNGFYNFTEQGSGEYFTAASVWGCAFIKRTSLPVYAILYQNNECRHILCEVFILDNACSRKIHSLCVLAPKWDKTYSACASLCPHLAFPVAEWKLLGAQTIGSNHTLLWPCFLPWHTRLNKMTCFITGENATPLRVGLWL